MLNMAIKTKHVYILLILSTLLIPHAPTVSSKLRVAQWFATLEEWNWDFGGNIHIYNLPDVLERGKTYAINVDLTFERTDHGKEFWVKWVRVGFVSSKNKFSVEEVGDVVGISYVDEKVPPPDWLGFDIVTVNKRWCLYETLSLTAYVTITEVPEDGKAYLVVDMLGVYFENKVGSSIQYWYVKAFCVFPAVVVEVSIAALPWPLSALEYYLPTYLAVAVVVLTVTVVAGGFLIRKKLKRGR